MSTEKQFLCFKRGCGPNATRKRQLLLQKVDLIFIKEIEVATVPVQELGLASIVHDRSQDARPQEGRSTRLLHRRCCNHAAVLDLHQRGPEQKFEDQP